MNAAGSEAPVVGIPMCWDERGRWRRGREYAYLDGDYAAAVAGCGGLPVYLPLQANAVRAVERIDALLLPGGDDLLPESGSRYADPSVFDPAPGRQLRFDRALLAEALARDLPILAICYGMQLLALERGGTLHYHLPVDVPEAAPHKLAEPEARHAVEVTSGTHLARLLGAGRVLVNSLHHQAVATPGRDMRVVARSADGVIEAVEAADRRFCVGVQWHPEKLEEGRDALFGGLIEACGAPAREAAGSVRFR